MAMLPVRCSSSKLIQCHTMSLSKCTSHLVGEQGAGALSGALQARHGCVRHRVRVLQGAGHLHLWENCKHQSRMCFPLTFCRCPRFSSRHGGVACRVRIVWTAGASPARRYCQTTIEEVALLPLPMTSACHGKGSPASWASPPAGCIQTIVLHVLLLQRISVQH